MREVPLGMLVTYTHITPRDDCPIRKVMFIFLLCFSDIPRTQSMVRPSLSTDFFGVRGDAEVSSGTTTSTTTRLVRIRKFL